MLRKKSEIWSADFITKKTLVKFDLYIITLSYLKNKLFCFIEFLNYGTKESNKGMIGLNIVVAISNNN